MGKKSKSKTPREMQDNTAADLCTSINIKPARLVELIFQQRVKCHGRKRWDQSFGSKCRRLIELFVSKDVSEDQQVIDYITAQCNISLEQDTLLGAGCNTSFPVNINDMSTEIQPQPFLGKESEGNDHLNSNHLAATCCFPSGS
ncbi:uncharacterized protein LOC110772050 [Prunus avium]|uniref:Uncharacterized protein LOC110772050 n=1 Tax=Prunus avium TaxID=42229 RepID=A0A6P5TZ58_PRUAV|nr:uncharacterized protein LOC110772050 [Prunus avium]